TIKGCLLTGFPPALQMLFHACNQHQVLVVVGYKKLAQQCADTLCPFSHRGVFAQDAPGSCQLLQQMVEFSSERSTQTTNFFVGFNAAPVSVATAGIPQQHPAQSKVPCVLFKYGRLQYCRQSQLLAVFCIQSPAYACRFYPAM